VLSVSQSRTTVWNSLADSLHDPALGPNSFRRQLNSFLFVHYYVQRIERIGDITCAV